MSDDSENSGGHSAEAGEHLSRYRVIGRIGRGGMGEVYRALDTRLEREVALKILPRALSEQPDARARFEREARAASALDQPNICTIHEIDETDDGRLFIAMALYEGETLERRIARGPLTVSEAVDVAHHVARGLERAHERGIAHRDLKPSNVMLTADGEVKILDFGIAKLADAERLTRTGDAVGTLDYMAPEQLEGGGADGRADIWSLGVVLYQMLTGSLPFAAGARGPRVARILTADPVLPSGLRAGIPPGLDELVLAMLAKDPAERIPSAGQVLERLAVHRPAIGAAVASSRAPRGTGRLTGTGRRVLAGLVAIVAPAVIALIALRSGADGSPIDSIAVLPFENLSSSPDGAYLSRGLTASLTDRLSQIDELRVVPRGIAAAYGGPDVDLRATGDDLSVRAVVTGEVGEVDGQLVVRAELIDIGRMSQIWGARFDRPMTDLLAVQDSLVREIADRLRLELTSDETRALNDPGTQNPEAYRLYLLSRFHNLSVSPEGLERGKRYAEEAVRLDPGYALAWAALADSYVARVVMGVEPRDEGYLRAREAARTAIALDDSLAAAHMVLGFVHHHGDWDWPRALAEFRRAVELDSTSADALQGVSEVYATLGDVERMVAFAERAAAVDPITPVIGWWLGSAYHWAGRHEEGLEALERTLELEPDNMLALISLPWVLSELDRHEEAVASMGEGLTRLGADPATSAWQALTLARAGRDREAREVLARVDTERANRSALARAWGWLGEPDRSFPLLDEALERRESALWWIRVDPGFDPLREDPRFRRILDRMGVGETAPS